MNRNNVWFKIWDVVYPFLMYYALITVFFYIAQLVFGRTTENYMYSQIFATVLTLPIMYMNFYRYQLKDAYLGSNKRLIMILAIPIMLLLSAGVNNVILMLPLAAQSEAFQDANSSFYGGIFIVQIIGSGILTPILEELVFRGIIFGRLSRMMKPVWAVIISAFMFAIIHLNIVQFPYAFVLGLALAILVYMTKTVWTAIIGHMVANIFAVFRTQFGWLDFLVNGSAIAWIISVIIILVGVLILCLCINKERKEFT